MFIPSIPIDPASGGVQAVAHPLQYARGALYGRILDDFRYEEVPTSGAVQESEVVRLQSLTIEEEL